VCCSVLQCVTHTHTHTVTTIRSQTSNCLRSTLKSSTASLSCIWASPSFLWSQVPRYVAACCSVFQCVAVRCSVLQSLSCIWASPSFLWSQVLRYVAACCSVLQCVTLCCSAMQCVAVELSEYFETSSIASVSCWWGGESAQDPFICRSLSAKEPLITGLFCVKWPTKIRHPMHLRHPVWASLSSPWSQTASIYLFIY